MAVVRDSSGNNTHVPDKSFTRQDQVRKSYAVTPSDTVDLPNGPASSILVGVAGNVEVTYVNGVTDIVPLAAGIWHPMTGIQRVKATNTTATDIRVA